MNHGWYTDDNLVGGDWNMNGLWLSIQFGMENHPKWRVVIFQRGRYTTNQVLSELWSTTLDSWLWVDVNCKWVCWVCGVFWGDWAMGKLQDDQMERRWCQNWHFCACFPVNSWDPDMCRVATSRSISQSIRQENWSSYDAGCHWSH